MTVVGVVRNERHNGVTAIVKEKFYVPYAQFPAARDGDAARGMTLVVRTGATRCRSPGPIRAEVRRLDPSLPVANVRPMTEVVDASLATPRLTGSLLSIFAGSPCCSRASASRASWPTSSAAAGARSGSAWPSAPRARTCSAS